MNNEEKHISEGKDNNTTTNRKWNSRRIKNSKKYFVSFEEFSQRPSKKFKCELCKINLSSKDNLRKHILGIHFKLKPHICDICNQRFIFEKSLLLHKEIHSDVPLYKCFCGKSFQKKFSFKYHMKRMHLGDSSASFKCTYCNRKFIDKKQLRYHLQADHTPRIIKCAFPSCKRLFSTRTFLLHHMKTHSDKRYTCSVCKKEFKDKSYMEKHEAAHQEFRPYKCWECDKTYISVSQVNAHWRRTHSGVRNHLCYICGKTFKNKNDVIYHENAHQRERSFHCDSCDFKTSSRASLLHHQKRHSKSRHKTERKIKSIRTEAERSQKRIPHYIKINSDSRPFKCLDCENAFGTAVRANEHWRRYHMFKTEFSCFFCHKRFSSQQDLSAHKSSHEGEEQFQCDLCSYKTAFRIGLFAHRKIHSKSTESGNRKCLEHNSAQNESKEFKDVEMPEDVTRSYDSSLVSSSAYKSPVKACAAVKEESCRMPSNEDLLLPNASISHSVRSIKENPKARWKDKRERPNTSNGKSTTPNYVWDEEECKKLSEGLMFESGSPLDSNLSHWEDSALQEEEVEVEEPRKELSSSLLRKRRDSRMTLNCAAIDHNWDDEEEFHFEKSYFTH